MYLPNDLIAQANEVKKVHTVQRTVDTFSLHIEDLLQTFDTLEEVLCFFIRSSSLNEKAHILYEIEPDKNKRRLIKKVALKVASYQEYESKGRKLYICDVEVTTICEVNNGNN